MKKANIPFAMALKRTNFAKLPRDNFKNHVDKGM
jgi:hypothetical protein